MTSILFVDDDKTILDKLLLAVAERRHDWHVYVASGASEAMSILRSREVDVLITDLNMPGIDGGQLLREVRRTFPQIARIMISGYAEAKEVMRTVGDAHQYLAKPLDPAGLIHAVEQTTKLSVLLHDDRLRGAVTHLKTVPSLPVVYSELLDEVNKTEPSVKKVSAIIKKDIGMTVKMLQIANSAYFGFQREVSDPAEAVRFLGLDTVTAMTLAIGVFSQFQSKNVNSGYINQIWSHSTRVAQIARSIARIERPSIADDAFAAGLLHDIGEIVMATNNPTEFVKTRNFAPEEYDERLSTEVKLFGATHAEIGAYLLSLWGLPETIVEAVAFHHNPIKSSRVGFSAVTAVHAADALIHAPEFDEEFDLTTICDIEYLDKSEVSDRLRMWFETCVRLSPETETNPV